MFLIIMIDCDSTKYYAPLKSAQVEKFMTEKGFKQVKHSEYRYWWHEEGNMHATVHKLDKLD